MVMFINESQSAGSILVASITNFTGDLFISLLFFILMLFVIASLFKIPIEYTSILVLPVILVCMAFSTQFLVIGGIMLIYLAIIFVKMFFLG